MSEQAKAPTHKVVRARATARGSSNGLREPGAEFDILVKLDREGKPVKGSWFDIVPEAEVKPLPKADNRNTLGEGGKQTGADLA